MAIGSRVARTRTEEGSVVLELAGDDPRGELRVDALLVATGRVPNTARLATAAAGLELDDEEFIQTDEYLRTNVDGVWALGDIVGQYQLKHSANLEAAHVAHNLLNPERLVPVDYRAMPHAVFASPQVGSVGLTEQGARATGRRHIAAGVRRARLRLTGSGHGRGDEPPVARPSGSIVARTRSSMSNPRRAVLGRRSVPRGDSPRCRS